MKEFETLYARNSNGKINEWKVETINHVHIFHKNIGGLGDYAEIVITEGLIDGEKTITRRKSKGKNIGKMNETSDIEQARKDAQSRWELKKKKGYKSLEDLKITFKEKLDSIYKQNYDYHYDIYDYNSLETALEDVLPKNRTDANNLSKPMKAQPYFKDNGDVRINFPCFGQPKLNGFRVISRLEKIIEGEGIFSTEVIKPTFRSKEGLRYTILEHIEPEIEILINQLSAYIGIPPKDIALDGEMYIHGEILSEISSAVRKRNPKTSLLKFCIFDFAIENVSQDKRINYLNYSQQIVTMENLTNIHNVETITVTDNLHAQSLTDQWIKENYEGAIFRDLKAIYQFGSRPKTMTKLKRSQDKEFVIKDVKGGDNTPDVGVFVCLNEEGLEFSCTPEGTLEVKKEYLANKDKYIGKKLTVRFFERTKDNKPNHAVGVAIRDYE